MKEQMQIERLVDGVLERIATVGERFGFSIGTASRITVKVFLGIGIVVLFGLGAFVYSMLRGMGKKK
jgi:hypothetical protein